MKKYPLIPVLIMLFGTVLMSACEKSKDEVPDLATIEYTLSSQENGKLADIEYTSGFGLIRLEDVSLPWSISFKAVFKIGDALSFKAESGDAGEMSAQIILDDEEVASETATHIIQLNYIKGFK